MFASVRAFFAEIIDYAGLFPPAQLPLPEAMANYVRYRQGPNSWMLGRFIIPAERLPELLSFQADITAIAPLRLSVLGRGGNNSQELVTNVRSDLVDIGKLGQALGNAIAMENYEVKLPASLFGQPAPDFFAAELFPLIGMVRNLLDTAQPGELMPFFEYPLLDPQAVRALTRRSQSDEMHARELLHDWDSPEDHAKVRFPRPGWKLRCGGVQANAFPTPEQVATVLAACGKAAIPWKATAGLHHPFRHFDAGLSTKMHGFVNVFATGVLAHAVNLEEGQLVEMLGDEDGKRFRFDDTGFSWKNHQAAVSAIRLARKNCVTSFGSCSFEEPCADLTELGWI